MMFRNHKYEIFSKIIKPRTLIRIDSQPLVKGKVELVFFMGIRILKIVDWSLYPNKSRHRDIFLFGIRILRKNVFPPSGMYAIRPK